MQFGVGDSSGRGLQGGGAGGGGGRGERERERRVFVELAAVCWTVALALLFAGGGDDGRRLPL